ncbi:TonB-dependent siderophore receptor [Rhizobiales bacterium RZME27]|uniref:TonB-dependent siderophore receptor n=1 Tax=Endobacterium cereale TaxID=2663029 RepID=A0A6A8AIJ4_9HYPH|nr:TonB-dependent siderophore receptor [Endobacterium cereale]MEB2844198.1 TonB-dependent siderophore receptor [Endobacterium cereale]MQY48611.1 TonB-dependent siderophore receptor [Endobacterium cereale]
MILSKTHMVLAASVAFAGCLSADAALAQDAAGATTLAPIVVTGNAGENPKGAVKGYVAKSSSTASKTGTPLIETQQSVSVITRDQIEAQNAQTLGEVLNYSPGVVGQPYGSDPRFDSPSIRGFDGRQSQFLNGLRLMRTFGASSFEVYGLERVEVLRGPASVMYGQGNPGGMINMISKRPTFDSFGEVGVQVGSHEYYGTFFDVGGPVAGSDTFAYRLTGMGRKAGEQTDFLDNDRYFIAPALTWKPDEDTSLTILTSLQHDNPSTPSGLPAALTLNATNYKLPRDFYVGDKGFDRSSRTLANIGYEFEHRFDETWTFRQNFRYSHFDWEYQALSLSRTNMLDPQTINRTSLMQDEMLNTFNMDNQLQAEFATGGLEHTVLFGLDTRYFDNNTLSVFGTAPGLNIFNPDYNQSFVITPTSRTDVHSDMTQIGLYVQDEIAYENWHATFGLRQDWARTDSRSTNLAGVTTAYDQRDSKLTGRAGLSYLFDNGISPYISYATSFEPIGPINRGTSGGVVVTAPGEPTTGEQVELGVKYQPEGFDGFFTAAVYDLKQQNLVRTVSPGVQEQIGEVHVRGLELEAVASLAEGLDLRAAYTYMDSEVSDTELRPETVPENAASLWLNYTFQPDTALEGLGIGVGMRYVGSRYGNAANTIKMGANILFDAALTYQKNGYKASLNIQNIADEEYLSSCGTFGCYYGEGRSVMGKLSFTW